MLPALATVEDFLAVVESLSDFWGERDVLALHHPMFVHEFGDTAFVIRAPDGQVVAYLLGFLTPARVGYVHLVGVHVARRGQGMGRQLYELFEATVRDRGAVGLKAITTATNVGSIAFHRSLGFSVTEVPDYVRRGESRVVLCRDLSSSQTERVKGSRRERGREQP
jgi:ribosomal protein S18 acetylase RimI-like enzyme